jgi:hypothetical protein
METVRLTVQLRDHGNTERYTRHVDVPIDKCEAKATEVAHEMLRVFKKERRVKAQVAAGS